MWGADREAETGERCGEQAEKQKQRRAAGSRQISKNRGVVCRAGREAGEGCGEQARKKGSGVQSRQSNRNRGGV